MWHRIVDSVNLCAPPPQDLIETIISTIQAPEVTEAGVAAVVGKLQAYSAGINLLVDALPPDTANGSDGGLGARAAV